MHFISHVCISINWVLIASIVVTNDSGKDLKRQTLLELVDYVNNPGGQKIFTEALMPDIMAMVVSLSLFAVGLIIAQQDF